MRDRKTTEWPSLHLFRGQRLSIREIARIGGIPATTVHRRKARGVPVERWADPVMSRYQAVLVAGVARGKQIKESRI